MRSGVYRMALMWLSGTRLAPDGLPDAALRGVPDAAALRALLAARELTDFQVIPDLYDKLVVARAQEGREVGRKGRVAAHVLKNVLAVAKYLCPLVARADVQKKSHTCRDRRDRKRSAVPENLPGVERSIDARELRFRRKRNENFAVPGVRSRVRFRDGIVPEAV